MKKFSIFLLSLLLFTGSLGLASGATVQPSLTEAGVDHVNIQSIGTNAHSAIDIHIADSTIHYTQVNITTLGTITSALVIGTANGIDINPGSDIDADLITVGVAGAPILSWNESATAFNFSENINSLDTISAGTVETDITFNFGTRTARLFISNSLDSHYALIAEANNNNAGAALMTFAKSRAGGAVNSGDSIGQFFFAGHDGTTYNRTADFRIVIDGTPGTGDMPGRMEFLVTPDGASIPSLAMVIKNDRRVAMGGLNTPLAALHIDQSSTTAAVPVFYLDQGDTSEPFVNFVGSSTAGISTSISSLNTSGATTDHIQIDLNGTKAWIAVSTNNPS